MTQEGEREQRASAPAELLVGNEDHPIMQTPHAKKWPVSVMALLLVVAPSPIPVSAQGQEISAASFKFTAVDNQLLDEVNEINRQLEKKGLVLHDPEVGRYIEAIGHRVTANQQPLEKVEFRFRVLRDPMVNASAYPDGTIYVTTGLLARLENEAQLASVLGHEATHAIQRHTYLENRSARKKVLAINILSGVAAVTANVPNSGTWGSAILQIANTGANVSAAILAASIFGYSREKEREADRHGLELMTLASYDPRAMPRTFQLLDEKLEFLPMESFYSDHPKLEEREKAAVEQIASENLKSGQLGTESDYLAHLAPAICANIDADLNSRRARTAVNRASRLVKWKPDEPQYQVLLGDAYRVLSAKAAEPTSEEETRHGQAEHRKLYFQMTEAEEQRRLLSKPEGVSARDNNFREAEQLYLAALRLNPDYAAAHRGLGFLYEDEAKPADAALEYRRYLDVTAGTSLDRLRVERRLAAVEKALPRREPQVPRQ